MDDITETMCARAAEKIARDHRNNQAQKEKPIIVIHNHYYCGKQMPLFDAPDGSKYKGYPHLAK